MKSLTVAVSVAGIYESAEPDGLLADELLCGMEAELVQRCEGGILRVRTAYGYQGYARGSDFIQEEAEWRDAPKLIVTGSYVNLQEQPSVRALARLSLPRGSLCRAEGPLAEGWQPVCLGGNVRGYLPTLHLSPYPMGGGLRGDALRQSLCQNALSYMGCCYRWGGKTPLGIDCSGLCSQVYLNHGIAIWRDAAILEGYPVKQIVWEATGGGTPPLQPADLLYWKGHMALWLGEGRYIHSSASAGGVSVSSLVKGEPGYREDLANTLLACGTVF